MDRTGDVDDPAPRTGIELDEVDLTTRCDDDVIADNENNDCNDCNSENINSNNGNSANNNSNNDNNVITVTTNNDDGCNNNINNSNNNNNNNNSRPLGDEHQYSAISRHAPAGRVESGGVVSFDYTASNSNSNHNNTSSNGHGSGYNRFSSASSNTSSGKRSVVSNKEELKRLRKPSDRIRSKSRLATFCYNVPRGSLMITLPGVVVLATGALLTATADYSPSSYSGGRSWLEGGVLTVSLVLLILGGVWTLAGIVYWLALWIRYKPPVVKRSELRPTSTSTTTTTPAQNSAGVDNRGFARHDARESRPFDDPRTTATGATPVSPGAPANFGFDSLSSPFAEAPHPIFSQQQLQQSKLQQQQQHRQQQ